ncbi:hypothetical protein AHiyo4_26630 [Arthrobacter sp. Hiyo4]|nr:hypothetical protein AHiyo4_26630 [Arthrobacter sp. Hiyo4]
MNGRVQDAAGFIDATLQNEGAWYRAEDVESRMGGSWDPTVRQWEPYAAPSATPAESSRTLATMR